MDRRLHITTGCFLLTGLGVALLEGWNFLSSSLPSRIEYFADDAFYYFEIAWHWSRGLGSTFDTLSETNGFHPLWMLLLVGLAEISPDRMTFLHGVSAISGLIWIASVWFFARLSQRLGSLQILCAALPLLIYQRRLWFNGMESGLLLMLMIAGLGLLAQRWQQEELPSWQEDFQLGSILLMTLFARLDAIFFVGLVCLLDLVRRSYSRDLSRFWLAFRSTLRVSIPVMVGLPAYMLANAWWFGVSSPISGKAKSLGPWGENLEVFSGLFELVPIRAPGLRQVDVALWLIVLVLPTLIACFVHSRRVDGEERRRAGTVVGFLMLLLTAGAVQMLYFALVTTWPLWRWYYYFVPLLLLISACGALNLISGFLPLHLRRVLPVAVLAVISLLFWRASTYERTIQGNYKRGAVDVVEILHRTTDASSIFAMGDRAGSMGFLLDRPLIQLEGLVNSAEYLSALEEGTVHEFLEERGIDYLIYSGGPLSGGDPTPVSQNGCSQFTEPKFGRGPKAEFVVCAEDLILELDLENPGVMGGRTSVWAYRPELNPLP